MQKTFGASLLIAGSCIGAAMIGMPLIASSTGFYPSSLMFFVAWAYMTITAFLLLEINIVFEKPVSIISMASYTLGKKGALLAWGLYLFLFYSLTLAYISASSTLIGDFFHSYLAFPLSKIAISLGIVTIFLILLYFGTKSIDLCNRSLMIGLLISYMLLICMGKSAIKKEYLDFQDWSKAPFILPTTLIAFGFHNLIPSLVQYLKKDRKKLRRAFFIGSLTALFIYLIWNGLILGIVPFIDGFTYAKDHGELATMALKNATNSPWIIPLAELFSFFAIITSFLGVSLSFVDFLSDGLKIKKNDRSKPLLSLLVLGPPLIISFFNPNLFLAPLAYAGGFGNVVLFGILPVAMVWRGRYQLKWIEKPFVSGGKPILVLVFIISIFFMGIQTIQEVNKLRSLSVEQN